jgi:large subunit ribosomal protein L16
MGKGKGNVSHWVCKIKPGRILYEVSGQNLTLIKNALTLAANKLPLNVKIIGRKKL